MLNPNDFINADFPTAKDVADLAMNPRFSKGLVTVPQLRILDDNRQPWVLPVPVDPNDPSALCSVNGQGYVTNVKPSMNDKDDVQRVLKFRLYEFPGLNGLNWMRVRLRHSTQYYFVEEDRLRLVNEIPGGEFFFTIPDRTLLKSGNYLEITAHDTIQEVIDCGFENIYTIPKGINVGVAARGMLMADNRPPSQGGRVPLNSCDGGGGTVGGLPGTGTGTGSGYCAVGYAVSDPNSGCVFASGVLYQRTATGMTGTIQYISDIGMKVDAQSGAPIDPWTCAPMSVATIAFDGSSQFLISQLDAAAHAVYIDTSTGKCFDGTTNAEVDPLTGLSATVATPLLFKVSLAGSFGSGGGSGTTATPNGNGAGYCPSFGWSVGDTEHAHTRQIAPGSSFYFHDVPEAGAIPVEYYYLPGVTGVKIDAATGHPIDPWACQQMPYATTGGSRPDPSWAPPLFLASRQYGAGNDMYFDTSRNLFYTWDGVQSAGHLTTIHPGWVSPVGGTVPTYPITIFELAGGDGGINTLPQGAVGPQAGPVGSYVWPDANAPGLTPSCCDTSGPNIPAYRISIVPTTATVDDTLPFGPKDNYLKSFNTLLDLGAYWPLYTNNYGNYRITGMPYADGTIPQPDPYFAYTNDEQSVIAAGIVQRILDASKGSIANKVVVVSESTKGVALVAVAYNHSVRSYVSVENLGRVIQKEPVIQLDHITDPGVLQTRAFIEVNFAALPAESIEMEVALNPFLEVHDVLGLHVFSPDGKTLEISTDANPFLVSSWEHDYRTRRTKLVCARLVPV